MKRRGLLGSSQKSTRGIYRRFTSDLPRCVRWNWYDNVAIIVLFVGIVECVSVVV